MTRGRPIHAGRVVHRQCVATADHWVNHLLDMDDQCLVVSIVVSMRVAFFMRQADSDWLAGKRGVVSSYGSANLFLFFWMGKKGNFVR